MLVMEVRKEGQAYCIKGLQFSWTNKSDLE